MRHPSTFYFEASPQTMAEHGTAVGVQLIGSAHLTGHGPASAAELAQVYQQQGLDALVHQLQADFTVLVVDGARQQVHVVSDAFASKPIYVAWDAKAARLRCATSIHGITSRAPGHFSIDWERLVYSRYEPQQHTFATIVKGVQRLKNARIATLDLDQKTWSIRKHAELQHCADAFAGFTAKDFVEAYRQAIEAAVAERLEGQSEVLVTLSGGFDSSIVYALAAQQATVHAATICTATSIHNAEMERAAAMSRAAGSQHLVLPVAFHEGPHYQEWVQLLLAREALDCGFEDLVKSQLLLRAGRAFPAARLLLTGMGSDQFNGGTTTFDYAQTGENESYEAFMSNMLRSKWSRYREAQFTPWFQFAYNLSSMSYREELWPFQHDAWEAYVRNNARSLPRKGVLLESKLSAANGFNIAYPFLDAGALEVLRNIPPELRGELLYDKQILRKAFRDVLPTSFHGQPKFYRTPKAAEKIYSYVKPLLYGHNYALLKLAFECSPGLRQRFSMDKLLAFLGSAANSEHFPTYVHVLKLLSIGLLEAHLLEGTSLHTQLPAEASAMHYSATDTIDCDGLGKQVLGKEVVEG